MFRLRRFRVPGRFGSGTREQGWGRDQRRTPRTRTPPVGHRQWRSNRRGRGTVPSEFREGVSRSAAKQGRIEVMRAARRSRQRAGLALALVALIGGGCRSDLDATRGTTTTAATSTTTTAATTTTAPVSTSVLAGYRAFWAAFLRAGDPMDPRHPDLVATAVGAQLEQVQKAFLARLSGGEVIRGTITTHPTVVEPVEASTATVEDCYEDATHLFDASTGKQKDSTPAVVNHKVRADMQLVDGVWKVAATHHEGAGCTP